MQVDHRPAACARTVSAYLVVKDAAAALAFYAAAFDAVEQFRLTEPSGKIGHAELRIGASTLMLADEYPDFGALAPPTVGGSPVRLHLYVDDADAVVAKALAAGATLMRAVADQFYGDRSGMISDPSGHTWFVASPTETVAPAEMQRRFTGALTGNA